MQIFSDKVKNILINTISQVKMNPKQICDTCKWKKYYNNIEKNLFK